MLVTNDAAQSGTGTEQRPWLIASLRCKNDKYRSVIIDQHPDHIRHDVIRSSSKAGHKDDHASALAYTAALFGMTLAVDREETARLTAWFPASFELEIYRGVNTNG
jgi:hypothetical protein